MAPEPKNVLTAGKVRQEFLRGGSGFRYFIKTGNVGANCFGSYRYGIFFNWGGVIVELLTKDYCAKDLKVTVRTIERYIELGQLNKRKKGNLVRIERREWETFKSRYFVVTKSA